MFDEKFLGFIKAPDLLALIGVPILVHRDDYIGVKIAARTLADDFGKVTEGPPSPLEILTEGCNIISRNAATAIIVGCIEASPVLRRLEENKVLDLDIIRGKWESFLTAVVDNPIFWLSESPRCCW